MKVTCKIPAIAILEVIQPEITQILSDTARFVDISDRFAKMFEQLPAHVYKERSAAITQIIGELSRVIVERPSAVVYSIHLESYRAANNVNIRVDFFKSLGLQAFSRCVDLPEKGIWHRVLVGTFDSRNQARKYQVQIQEELSIAESRIIALPPEPKRPS